MDHQHQRVGTAGQSIGRQHNIVEKDYFRAMKTTKLVEKHFQEKPKTSKSLNKFKSRSQLIIEEYTNPTFPKEKLYMIDKVVRMRGLMGRYGVDHSEILNFEFELANKDRSNHMNRLVYKDLSQVQTASEYGDDDKENDGKLTSTALFKRLSQKELEYEDNLKAYQTFQRTNQENRNTSSKADTKLSFNEWVRRKDAEKRMKTRLVKDMKNEIRQEIFEIAQKEQMDQDIKVKIMEDWLMQKRLTEAQKIAQMREMEEKEDIEKQMREEKNFKSYKEWLKKQIVKDKHQKYQLLQQRQDMMEKEREEQMRRSIEAQIHYKQWQNDKNREQEERDSRRITEEQYTNENQSVVSSQYSPLRQRKNRR